MTELKPCPFCGNEDIRVERIYNYYEVICSDCLSRTEEYPTKEEAIEVWNNRPSPWHTGIPTDEGWYVCKLYDSDLYETQYFTNNNWDETLFEKWQKIEEKHK